MLSESFSSNVLTRSCKGDEERCFVVRKDSIIAFEKYSLGKRDFWTER